MYIHPLNAWESQPEVLDFIQKNSFATLYTHVEGRPWATHLPVFLEGKPEGKFVLHGHLAKANSQWKHLTQSEEVMVVFHGPHAYISSSWYTHENVPTWNYLAVHVYGKVRLIEGEELMHHLKSLVDQYETGRPNRVQVETMTRGYLEGNFEPWWALSWKSPKSMPVPNFPKTETMKTTCESFNSWRPVPYPEARKSQQKCGIEDRLGRRYQVQCTKYNAPSSRYKDHLGEGFAS